jgi:ankyrin repeat protein
MFGIEPIVDYQDPNAMVIGNPSWIDRLQNDLLRVPGSLLDEDAKEIIRLLGTRLRPFTVYHRILSDFPLVYELLYFYGACEFLRLLPPHYHFPESTDYGGRTIAHFAAAGRHLQSLVSSRSDSPLIPLFNIPDNEGFTPIQYAASYGGVSDLEFLASDDQLGERAMTVLHRSGHEDYSLLDLALANGQIEAAFFLLSTAIDWLSLSPRAFLSMAEHPWLGRRDELPPLIDELLRRRFDRAVQNHKGHDAVTIAAKRGSELLWELIESDPTILSSETVWNPFLVAAKANNLSLLSRLFTSGHFEIDFPNKEGETALMTAVRYHREETIEWLLNHGADPQKCEDRNLVTGLPFIHDRLPTEQGILLYISLSQRIESRFVFSRLRHFCSLRNLQNELNLQEIVSFLQACEHFRVSRRVRESNSREFDGQMTFQCTMCQEDQCELHLKWVNDARVFSLSTTKYCAHCFERLLQKENPHARSYRAVCYSANELSFDMRSDHPLRKLSRKLPSSRLKPDFPIETIDVVN